MARPGTQPKSSSNRMVALVVGGLVATMVAAAAIWFWPKPTLLPETAALARGMFDAGGAPDKQAIRQVVGNVDRMPRDQLTQLWRTVGEEWRRLRQGLRQSGCGRLRQRALP